MALRNAFDLLGTEGTLRRILAAVSYARTQTDQLRVNVDSGTVSQLNTITWANANTTAAYYSTGAPNSMDLREQQRAILRANYQQRTARWTY